MKSFDALGSIITGASSPEQLKESIQSYNGTLSEAQIKHARSIVKILNTQITYNKEKSLGEDIFPRLYLYLLLKNFA